MDINVDYDDISHLDHEDFLDAYIKVSKNKINEDTIIITYSNASVKEYNDKIREYFFPK